MKNIEILNNEKIIRGILHGESFDHIVILVHGFAGNLNGPNDIFVRLVEKLLTYHSREGGNPLLLKQDFSVLRFSFSGTPPSDGDFVDMILESEVSDLKKVLEFVKNSGYKKISILGESMGGAVVAKVLPEDFSNIIFWYSCFDFLNSSFKQDFLSEGPQKFLAENGFVQYDDFKVGKKFIDEIPFVNTYEDLKKINSRVLFLHGDSDTDTPSEQSQIGFEKVSTEKHLKFIEGANHCFRNEQDEAIDLTINFLRENF
ncbi:MAG: alpha/beta hydrolase [Patescibacteria group bacterium]